MKKIIGLIAVVGLFFSASAMAEFDKSKIYVGGGLASNSMDSSGFDSAIGFQGFAGYDMADIVEISDEVGFAVEIGYAQSGDYKFSNSAACGAFCSSFDFSADGLWTNAVFDYAINDKIKAVGRVGMDLGDDDGIMFGAGAGYALNDQMAVRAEYVIRKNMKGIQANFVYYLGD